jgi:hypothetical protein
MSELEIWKIFVSLGVPGLALGVFYMLFRTFSFKFPKVPRNWVGPIIVLFMLLTSGVIFYALTLWSPSAESSDSKIKDISYEDYLSNFFDSSKKSHVLKQLIALNELEVRQFERMFANSSWDGGEHWRSVSFDVSGRRATYTNNPGRSPGTILIQGAPPGTVPIVIGEWFQEDKQEGKFIMGVDSFHNPTKLQLSWGPGFTAKTLWKRKN